MIARFRVVAFSLAAVALLSAAPASQQRGAAAYTVVMPDGKRMTLPFRTVGNTDLVSLDQLVAAFGLTLAEDTAVGGLTVRGRGQTILLMPGQSMASVGPGRIVSLTAAVQQSGNAWFVPVDFLRLALGPALGLKTPGWHLSGGRLGPNPGVPAALPRPERAPRESCSLAPPPAWRPHRAALSACIRPHRLPSGSFT